MQHAHQHHAAPDARFPTEPAGLAAAAGTKVIDLADGDTARLRIAPVAKRIADATVRMLAYNGSVPGPTLRVRQGSEIAVDVVNEGNLETTVHWHGLRLENRYHGTHETQAPIPVGGPMWWLGRDSPSDVDVTTPHAPLRRSPRPTRESVRRRL